MVHQFLDRHPQLKNAPRSEFVDDGYTGTNTNRPQFQALMKELRTGAINVMVTKDFSRCHRDYTQMGNYLECVFPFLGVRYISVNDGYDSDDYKGVTSGMDVVLRNIIYEVYSKDLSVKTSTAKIIMMKQGKYIGDYYIPDLTLGDQTDKPIGLYGRMRHTYLQAHRPGVFNNMVLNGTLYSHLVVVDEAAQHRLDVLMPQLAKTAGATEELKARDQMAWVRLMNSCKARVEEIIRDELIYV